VAGEAACQRPLPERSRRRHDERGLESGATVRHQLHQDARTAAELCIGGHIQHARATRVVSHCAHRRAGSTIACGSSEATYRKASIRPPCAIPARKKRRIEATILVERASQKAIVVGARGERLKRMASAARKDMEQLFGGKVYLGTWVKVRKAWTDDARVLRQLGYE